MQLGAMMYTIARYLCRCMCVLLFKGIALLLMQVVETCHNAGISKLVVKLRPIAVIKG